LKPGQNIKYLPYAFTEYGGLMAANILNNPRAIQMSIFVVRAFAKMREALRASPQLARKLAALEKKLTSNWTFTKRRLCRCWKKSSKS